MSKFLLIIPLAIALSGCVTPPGSFTGVERTGDGAEIYVSGVFDVKVACLNWQGDGSEKAKEACSIPFSENGGMNAKSIRVQLPACDKDRTFSCIEQFDFNNSPPESIKIRNNSGTVIVPFAAVPVKLRVEFVPGATRSYSVIGIG